MTVAPPYTGPVIPTWYDHTLFRSRTEARWAKFFHELGVPYEYETEGFMPEGVWYLPDFIVFPATGPLWAEVKPVWRARGEDKFRHFAGHRPKGTRAALFVGPPRAGAGNITLLGGDIDADDPLKGPWEDEGCEWRPCGSGHHFDVAYAGTFRAKFAGDGCPDDFGGDGEEKLRRAVEAARSFRFGKGDG